MTEVQAEVQVGASRGFWRGALVAGGFTAIPRWSVDPAIGTAEDEAKIPDDLIATLRRLADELGVTASSVLLAAHAKVLAALSGNARSRRATLAGEAASRCSAG